MCWRLVLSSRRVGVGVGVGVGVVGAFEVATEPRYGLVRCCRHSTTTTTTTTTTTVEFSSSCYGLFVVVAMEPLRVVVRRYCHSTQQQQQQHNTTITTTDKYMHTRNCLITLVCNRYRLRFVWIMSNFESKIVWLFIYDWWLFQRVWNNKLYAWLSKTIFYHRLVSVMAQIELNKWVMDKWIVKILRSDRLL